MVRAAGRSDLPRRVLVHMRRPRHRIQPQPLRPLLLEPRHALGGPLLELDDAQGMALALHLEVRADLAMSVYPDRKLTLLAGCWTCSEQPLSSSWGT